MLPVWRWLGRVPFEETARLQERLREAILRGEAPETLLFCEHHPVVTCGRSARAEHLLVPPDDLERRGVSVHSASRGGDVTYHGPGQLVGYPIVRLRGGVVGHLTAIARAVATVLAGMGVAAEWRRETPGLWVGDAKICAVGVHVRHRVAIHGFALNVAAGLEGFDLIVPCGLRGTRVTSIARELPPRTPLPALHLIAAGVARALGSELGLELVPEVDRAALCAPFSIARPSDIGTSFAKPIEMSSGITRMIGA